MRQGKRSCGRTKLGLLPPQHRFGFFGGGSSILGARILLAPFGNHRIEARTGPLRCDEPSKEVRGNRVHSAHGLGNEAGLAAQAWHDPGFFHDIAGLDEARELAAAGDAQPSGADDVDAGRRLSFGDEMLARFERDVTRRAGGLVDGR